MTKFERNSLALLPSVRCLRGAIDGLLTGGLGRVNADANTEVGEIMFVFACGRPNAKLLLESLTKNGPRVVIPDTDLWLPYLRKELPDRSFTTDSRFAFHPLQHHLVMPQLKLPYGFSWKELDFDGLNLAAKQVNPNLLRSFWSEEKWGEFGMAFGIEYDGQYVCGSSAFAAGRKIVEAEIATHEAYRRRGLAQFASMLLTKKCLEAGKAISWDAANSDSRDLAMKLGFKFSHEYPVILVS